MKLSKILKRALSLFIVGLFVFTAFAVIQSGGGQAQASPSASSSFTFPYQYGTPTVPSDVGAQGTQGPTVPVSDIGPQGNVGASGNIGTTGLINPYGILKGTNVTLSVKVLNGTVSSNTISVDSTVSLLNLTYGTTTSLSTDANGYANLTVSSGWYELAITQKSASYENFTQYIDISASNTITRYLIPASDGVLAISNGGTSFATLWVHTTSSFGSGMQIGQVPVELYNETSTQSLYGTTYSLSNGSVEFTGLNIAMKYGFTFPGQFTNPLTDFVSNYGNLSAGMVAGNGYTFAAGVDSYTYSSLALCPSGKTTTTATISGNTLPAYEADGEDGFVLSENTTINGGITYLSYDIHTNGYKIIFENGKLYLNATGYGYTVGVLENIQFINETVISLTGQLGWAGSYGASIWMNHSVYIGNDQNSITNSNGNALNFAYANNSYIEDAYGFFSGNLSNDIIYNSQMTKLSGGLPEKLLYLENTTITGSSFVNGETPILKGYGVKVIDASDLASGGGSTFYVNNSYLQENHMDTHPFYVAGKMMLSHDNVTYVNTTATVFASGNTGSWRMSNISYSILWFQTYHENSTKGTVIINVHNIDIYNSIIDTNYTNTQDLSNIGVSAFPAPATVISIDNGTISYDILNFGGDGTFGGPSPNGSVNFTHDVFTYENEVDAYTIVSMQMFSASGTSPISHESVTYSNDTFGYLYYNNSLLYKITTASNGPDWYTGSGQWIENMNSQNGQGGMHGYLNITHVTFEPPYIGNNTWSVNSGAAGVEFGQNQTTNSITYSLFENNYRYALGPDRYNITPVTWDIIAFAGNDTIANNWFMNLNQQIIPIGGNNLQATFQNSGTKPQGTPSHDIHLSNNHFYYSPSPDYSYVPLNNNFHAIVNASGKGTISYELPINTTQKYSFGACPEYIWNWTTKQVAPSYMWSGNDTSWYWGIAPDVNTSTGTPVISYQNGLVAGPQPNFEWHGYNYSESVEPTYIQIGVNSSKAPSIGLQFQGMAGGLYDIEMFNNGSLISTYQESATSLGVLNATYNPATMPLDPVFSVELVGSVAPPPVAPPLVPIVPHVLFGIPYLNVIVLFGGIALASEEFFRTQTKGKEKKYSYTGIFVGIMIAGIGLMSVL